MLCALYLVFLLLFISTIDSTEVNTFKSEMGTSLNDSECTIYMAQSSISGAGFGIFTTRDFLEGEDILPYSDAPNIVVCDHYEMGVENKDWTLPDYFWGASSWGDFECIDGSESVMSFGSLCNFHTMLSNVKGLRAGYDDEAANRYIHPSAGAFTYHKGHSFKAGRKITAGEELFADYGENWLDTREGTFTDNVPRQEDFSNADSILRIMRDNFLESSAQVDDEVLALVKDATEVFNERVASLVPNTKASYEALIENLLDEENALAKSTVMSRGVKWIKENGLCLENILPGKSTIPFVGQGAFANRFLAEGSIVSPIPLTQMMNSDIMTTYDIHWDDEHGRVNVGDKPTGKQLLLNYCFGHKDSKLLLCPLTNAILINHCSMRKNAGDHCGTTGPNAKIQWASGWDPSTSAWLEMPMSRLAEATAAKTRGLSLEVIATRDIKAGEEVFIDYGPNWEDAWESHKAMWNPPAESNRKTLNSIIGNTSLRLIDELDENPYPDNIMTVCFWYEYIEEGYNPDERGYYDAHDYLNDDLDNANLWQCDLLKRIGDTHYEVRIIRAREGLDDVFLTMYPWQSITFRMKRYTSDQHLPGAFRHFIEINDDIFPEQWKTAFNHTEENFSLD